jgi:hypothetical protein
MRALTVASLAGAAFLAVVNAALLPGTVIPSPGSDATEELGFAFAYAAYASVTVWIAAV